MVEFPNLRVFQLFILLFIILGHKFAKHKFAQHKFAKKFNLTILFIVKARGTLKSRFAHLESKTILGLCVNCTPRIVLDFSWIPKGRYSIFDN